MTNKKLDEIDFEILRILQKDARQSYRTIRDATGISIGTIHNRISKLKEEGIIEGFILKVNDFNLGYRLTFMINIEIDGKYAETVLTQLSQMTEICAIFLKTGKQSAELICKFKEVEDANKFILSLNINKNILNVDSHMVLREYKNMPNIQIPLVIP